MAALLRFVPLLRPQCLDGLCSIHIETIHVTLGCHYQTLEERLMASLYVFSWSSALVIVLAVDRRPYYRTLRYTFLCSFLSLFTTLMQPCTRHDKHGNAL